jgi:hypothetical protein
MTAPARYSDEIMVVLEWRCQKDVVSECQNDHIGLDLNDVLASCKDEPLVVAGGLKDALRVLEDVNANKIVRNIEQANPFESALTGSICAAIQNENKLVVAQCHVRNTAKNTLNDVLLIVNRHHNTERRLLVLVVREKNLGGILIPLALRLVQESMAIRLVGRHIRTPYLL